MAGTRIVGEYNIGNTANGTALRVYQAVMSELNAHHATLVSAVYVDGAGAAIPGGNVVTLGTSQDAGSYGSIPIGSIGVVVQARVSWHPFLLGVIGITNWAATTTATSVTAGQSLGGGVFPIGVQDQKYQALPSCPVTNLDACISGPVTGGKLSPGNFGWLGFGDGGSHCEGVGLGMDLVDNCQPSATYIGNEVQLPVNTHGCCTAISGLPVGDRIAADTGAKASVRIGYYITNQIAVWVPIWDIVGGGPGNNTFVHVVGFAAMIFTDQAQGAKDLYGFSISGVDCNGAGNHPVTEQGFSFSMCAAPGGAITLGATGGVRLVH
jgi:hypothetical protein